MDIGLSARPAGSAGMASGDRTMGLTDHVTTVAAGSERSPGRPRDMAVRERVLNATLLLLGQVGYERLTIEGVAALADAGKATIYRWWGGKPELVCEALGTAGPMAAESLELLALVEREQQAGGLRAIVAEAAYWLVAARRER